MTWRDQVTIDRATNASTMIEYEHHEIHAGSSFTAHYSRTTTSDDNHRTAIGFTAPNTKKWLHIVVEITASSPAEFFLLESPTIANDQGTQATVYNRNRNKTTTSTIVDLATTPTANKFTTFTEAQIAGASFSGGTELDYILLAGGEGPKAVGGAGRGSQEWVLDQSKKYLFILKNIGANANIHEIHLDWYEHTDKA